jgi:hypothetical protein
MQAMCWFLLSLPRELRKKFFFMNASNLNEKFFCRQTSLLHVDTLLRIPVFRAGRRRRPEITEGAAAWLGRTPGLRRLSLVASASVPTF